MKARSNALKHGVHFIDAAESLRDPFASSRVDPDAAGEQRFVTIGADQNGRVLVTVYVETEIGFRIISSRKASAAERMPYTGDT